MRDFRGRDLREKLDREHSPVGRYSSGKGHSPVGRYSSGRGHSPVGRYSSERGHSPVGRYSSDRDARERHASRGQSLFLSLSLCCSCRIFIDLFTPAHLVKG